MFLGGFRLAVTLLTAIPLPGGKADGPPSRPVAGAAMIWAPVIGLLLGGAAAGVLYVFQRFWHAGPLVGAVLAVIVLAVLTRCLHLDQVTALTQAEALGRGVTSVITAAVTGRLAVTWACRHGVAAARGEGLGALVAGTVHPAFPIAFSAAALGGAAAYGLIFVAAVAAGLAAALAVTRLAVRRLGGITGDVLGALTEIATAVCLLVLALS